MKIKKILLLILCLPLILVGIGFLWPEAKLIPVNGAQVGDWAEDSFWFEPWGYIGRA